ncbi:MAG: hypothetical protein ACLPSF_09135 [Methylocella sp.]
MPVAVLLIASGAATALVGLAAFFTPRPFLRLVLKVEAADGAMLFFVRHWGVLLAAVGALIAYSAQAPASRLPILAAAIVEKFAGVLLIFFGPAKRTAPLTAIAIADGVLAALYVAIIAGA